MGSWGEMFEAAAQAAKPVEEFDEDYGSAPPLQQLSGTESAGYPRRKGYGKGGKSGKSGKSGKGEAGKPTWRARGPIKEGPASDVAASVTLLEKRVARLEAALEAAGIEIPHSDSANESDKDEEEEDEEQEEEEEEEEEAEEEEETEEEEAEEAEASDGLTGDPNIESSEPADVEPPLQAGDSFAEACFQAALSHDNRSHRRRRGAD